MLRTSLSRCLAFALTVVLAHISSGCESETTLSIGDVEITFDDGPLSADTSVSLVAQVNHDGGPAATVALAALTQEPTIIQRGEAATVPEGGSVQLSIEVPYARPHLRNGGCLFSTKVYLAGTGDPPTLEQLWADATPADNSYFISLELELPSPETLVLDGPAVSYSRPGSTRPGYRVPMSILPAPPLAPITSWELGTTDDDGAFAGNWLGEYSDGEFHTTVSGRPIGVGAPPQTLGTITAHFRNCDDSEGSVSTGAFRLPPPE